MSSYTSGDSPYVLVGPYVVQNGIAGAGIDSGLQQTNSNPKGHGWNSYLTYNKHFYGQSSFLPCGGEYEIWVAGSSINQNTNQFELTACYNFGKSDQDCIAAMDVQVPATQFLVDGSNYVFRRLTSLAQDTNNFNSQEWFGFDTDSLGGPNLGSPEIAYYVDELTLYGDTQAHQIDSTNSYASRYPDDPDKVLCAHDPANPGLPDPNFNDYEGVDLGNPNTVGTLPGNPC